jgi:SagB-type dehydrogenase family enzyme
MMTELLEQSARSMQPTHGQGPDRGPLRPLAGTRGRLQLRSTGLIGLALLSAMGVAAQQPARPSPVAVEKTAGDPRADAANPQAMMAIKLDPPNKKRGLPLMEAMSLRASTWEWADKNLLLQDLSDLLWAANGINRPDSKKRTAPSAVNAQDVDIYVFLKDGGYLYDAGQHTLNPVTAGDHRAAIDDMSPGEEPSALLILVSDISRFRVGTEDDKLQWAALDSGIVSQNISLFCAATGLGTRPRTDMNKAVIKSLLKLKPTQLPILNQAVGHPKQTPSTS